MQLGASTVRLACMRCLTTSVGTRMIEDPRPAAAPAVKGARKARLAAGVGGGTRG